MPFAPMFDRIVIEPIEEDVEKVGSLFVAPGAESPYGLAVIVDVGPGIYLPDGSMRPIHAQIGEVILYNKTTTLPYNKGGEDVKFICERDIVAKWYPQEGELEEIEEELLNESK